MNRILKKATVKRYHYASHDQLRDHLAAFLDAHNFARRLKTLRGLTHTRRPAKPGLTIQAASDTIRPISPRD